MPRLEDLNPGAQVKGILPGGPVTVISTKGHGSNLAPTNAQLAIMANLLRNRGYETANIKEEDFSFRLEKIIRLSILHPSKGLDFPVVLLYLAGLTLSSQYDVPAADKLLRNLIYVAMTRAMDNLNVFILKYPQEAALRDLLLVFQNYLAGQEEQARG